jgi:hypothetical protein
MLLLFHRFDLLAATVALRHAEAKEGTTFRKDDAVEHIFVRPRWRRAPRYLTLARSLVNDQKGSVRSGGKLESEWPVRGVAALLVCCAVAAWSLTELIARLQVGERRSLGTSRPLSAAANARRDLPLSTVLLTLEGVGNANPVGSFYAGANGGPSYGVVLRGIGGGPRRLGCRRIGDERPRAQSG